MVKWIMRARRRLAEGEGGFTLVEILVSMFIFALVMTAVVSTMSSALSLTRNNRSRSVAANLASQQVDSIQQQAQADFTGLVNSSIGQTSLTQNVDQVPYTILTNIEWQAQGTTAGPCDGPNSPTSLAFLAVQVDVTWPNMLGAKQVESNTLITPPVGTYQPNTGDIGVKVLDSNASPLDGAYVMISGPGVNDTQFTGQDGCAFFAYEPPGTYTVTLTNAGYVDGQGVASPVQTVTVVSGSTASAQFNYDQSATIVAMFTSSSGRASRTTLR